MGSARRLRSISGELMFRTGILMDNFWNRGTNCCESYLVTFGNDGKSGT
jgi:hypothetical protein